VHFRFEKKSGDEFDFFLIRWGWGYRPLSPLSGYGFEKVQSGATLFISSKRTCQWCLLQLLALAACLCKKSYTVLCIILRA